MLKRQTDKKEDKITLTQTIKKNTGNYNLNIKTNQQKSAHKSKSNLKSQRGDTSLKKQSDKEQVRELSLKEEFDELVKATFLKIDFECSGFITHTKISYCKQLQEPVFYFFGGVFQKIKHLGAVTMKMFLNLCNQAFLQASKEDLYRLLNKENIAKPIETDHIVDEKDKTVRLKLFPCRENNNSHNSGQFKSMKKMKENIIVNSRNSTQPDLRKECFFRSENNKNSISKITDLNLNFTQQMVSDSYSLQSYRVSRLGVILDQQLERNKKRLFGKGS